MVWFSFKTTSSLDLDYVYILFYLTTDPDRDFIGEPRNRRAIDIIFAFVTPLGTISDFFIFKCLRVYLQMPKSLTLVLQDLNCTLQKILL